MIGTGGRSFGSFACFCLSFLLEGMGTGCPSHPSYGQSGHLCLPAQLDPPLPRRWAPAVVPRGGDFSRVEREGRARLYLHPLPHAVCARAQIHGEKGGGGSRPALSPSTTQSLPQHPQTSPPNFPAPCTTQPSSFSPFSPGISHSRSPISLSPIRHKPFMPLPVRLT